MNFFLLMALPWKLKRNADGWAHLVHYRRLWRTMVTMTLFISLMPLLVMIVVNFFLYRKNIKAATEYDISRSVTNISRALEFTIEDCISAMEFLVLDQTRESLASAEHMTQAFNNLKTAFGNFVDLGLIDANGNQDQYSGPYNLRNTNYSDQSWFHEVTLRRVYVSEVFLGYRQFPHFVIAIKHDVNDENFFVLRATIDLELLGRHMAVPIRGRESDLFLINRDGILQTSSRFHGEMLQTCSVPLPPYSPGIEIIEGRIERQETYVLGYRYIENTPFILMVIEKRVGVFGEWLRTRTVLFLFLLISILLTFLIVLWSYTVLVQRLRAADLQQVKLMHNVEYTNKMAAIGRLAASVAHEINNPLAIINEKAGLLKDMFEAPSDFIHRDKTLGVADSIIRSVDRCSAVTHRLLGFTRRLESRTQTIDLADLLEEVLSFVSQEASHRNIEIKTVFQPETPSIQSDRGQLQQIFLNIINNAVSELSEHGILELRLQPLGSHQVQVSVVDNGAGISAENVKLIFEPFFSTKGEFGTGLGLSITYDLVKRLGGNISVSSEIDKGTRFDV
ncbi:MAG: ATP-binding protein, partial [bacterium]